MISFLLFLAILFILCYVVERAFGTTMGFVVGILLIIAFIWGWPYS